jgi:DNA primase
VLVHFPAAATAVSDPESLATVDRPGIPLLIELLQSFREEPAASTGHLLERWRGRPDYSSLAKLAARECLVPDVAAARSELREAVTRLIQDEAPVERLDALLEKGRTTPLTAEEKLEIQELLKGRASRTADRGGERT